METGVSKTVRKLANEYVESNKCTLWQINNGQCENFAMDLLDALGGYGPNTYELTTNNFFNISSVAGEIAALKDESGKYYYENYGKLPDDIDPDEFRGVGDHVWVYHAGKHYDAEDPNGVENFLDLPLFRRAINRYRRERLKKKTKPDFITHKKMDEGLNLVKKIPLKHDKVLEQFNLFFRSIDKNEMAIDDFGDKIMITISNVGRGRFIDITLLWKINDSFININVEEYTINNETEEESYQSIYKDDIEIKDPDTIAHELEHYIEYLIYDTNVIMEGLNLVKKYSKFIKQIKKHDENNGGRERLRKSIWYWDKPAKEGGIVARKEFYDKYGNLFLWRNYIRDKDGKEIVSYDSNGIISGDYEFYQRHNGELGIITEGLNLQKKDIAGKIWINKFLDDNVVKIIQRNITDGTSVFPYYFWVYFSWDPKKINEDYFVMGGYDGFANTITNMPSGMFTNVLMNDWTENYETDNSYRLFDKLLVDWVNNNLDRVENEGLNLVKKNPIKKGDVINELLIAKEELDKLSSFPAAVEDDINGIAWLDIKNIHGFNFHFSWVENESNVINTRTWAYGNLASGIIKREKISIDKINELHNDIVKYVGDFLNEKMLDEGLSLLRENYLQVVLGGSRGIARVGYNVSWVNDGNLSYGLVKELYKMPEADTIAVINIDGKIINKPVKELLSGVV